MGGLLIAGLGAGLIAGLFGVGGGLVFVPVLYFLYSLSGAWQGMQMQVALGTSLGAVLITGLASAAAHGRQRTVEWPLVGGLGVGLALGAFVGAALASGLETTVLRRFFGVFECLVGLHLLRGRARKAGHQDPRPAGWALAGLGIGVVSALLGIGGGTLTVPLLVWAGRPIERAVGTAAACGVPIALAGVAGYLWWGRGTVGGTGFVDVPALLILGAGAVLMAPLGARLALRLPRRHLQRLFAVFLILVGLRMLF